MAYFQFYLEVGDWLNFSKSALRFRFKFERILRTNSVSRREFFLFALFSARVFV